jgi:hypothetical protein
MGTACGVGRLGTAMWAYTVRWARAARGCVLLRAGEGVPGRRAVGHACVHIHVHIHVQTHVHPPHNSHTVTDLGGVA